MKWHNSFVYERRRLLRLVACRSVCTVAALFSCVITDIEAVYDLTFRSQSFELWMKIENMLLEVEHCRAD